MISHKPLLDPKSHSSLSWCLSDAFLTHGPGGPSPKGPAGDPSGSARCSGVSLACTLLPGGWGFEEIAVGSGKGRLTGRQPGSSPAYASGEWWAPGSSLPFPRISFLVDKMKCQVRWSLGSFPALRTRFCLRYSQGGQRGLGFRSVPRFQLEERPELGALPP